MRILLYMSVFIVGLIFIKEFFWIGKTDLALVMMGFSISIGLQAIYLIKKFKD